MELEFRTTQPDEIELVWAIVEQARARLRALGIDQWQGGYPDHAAIEGDAALLKSYVVAGVEDGLTRCAETSTLLAETQLEHITYTPHEHAVLATAMFEFGGEPTYDAIDGAWLTDATAAAPSYLVVHRVAVADGAMGKGVARFLLAQAEASARAHGCKSVRIDTHEGNVPMRNLLAKCGYTYCGIILLDDPAEPTRERLAFEKLV